MTTLFLVGVNRVFYKAVDFGTGKTVTAYFWSPAMVKSDLQTFTEIESGLYYLDYNFAVSGSYVALFYEAGIKTTFTTFRVKDVSADVLDELLASHEIPGSVGKKISDLAAGSGAGDGAISWPVTVMSGGLPQDGVEVWVTTDLAGTNIIASGFTNASGVMTFYLDAGTYYLWCRKSGINFTNPETIVVS